jgi:hypothetical protein
VRCLDHEDVVLTSNLKMTMGPAFHSLVRLGAYKM